MSPNIKFVLLVVFLLADVSVALTQNETIDVLEDTKHVADTVRDEEYVYTFVDEVAEFPGGMNALKSYLAENIIYPKEAEQQGIEGKCYATFVVLKDGTITDIKIKRGVAECPDCDQEVIRVIQKMPKWKAAKVNGRKVDSMFSLPITFKLAGEEKKE